MEDQLADYIAWARDIYYVSFVEGNMQSGYQLAISNGADTELPSAELFTVL